MQPIAKLRHPETRDHRISDISNKFFKNDMISLKKLLRKLPAIVVDAKHHENSKSRIAVRSFEVEK